MSFSLKDHEQEARERMRAFWQGSSMGRPAMYVAFKKPGFSPIPDPTEGQPQIVKDHSIDYVINYAQNYFEGTVFMAEAMPCAPLAGQLTLGAISVAVGGTVRYHDHGHAWTDIMPDVYDRPLPVFDPKHPVILELERLMAGMAGYTNGMGMVAPPNMMDALTTLSQFRTPKGLCYDLVERPETVKRWAAAFSEVYNQGNLHFYAFNKTLGYPETTSWVEAFTEGLFDAVECDFASMISPVMFEEFTIPQLQKNIEVVDRSLYHLDGVCQIRFLPVLRKLDRLDGIQWNPEPGTGTTLDWLDAFYTMRNLGFLIHTRCDTVEEAVALTKALGPDGLFLWMPKFNTKDEAEDCIRRVQAVS